MHSKGLEVYGIVDNLLDMNPPVGYTFVGAGSGNGGYDVVGRSYKVGMRFKF